jgi:hypothetical protein
MASEPTKKQLKERLDCLEKEYDALVKDYLDRCRELNEIRVQSTKKKFEFTKAGTLSFDYWPPSDWLRFSVHRWKPGQYFQINLGPFRFDWYAS